MENLNCSLPWVKYKGSLNPCGNETSLKHLVQLVQQAYANKSIVKECNVPNCENIMWNKATERFKEVEKWAKEKTVINLFFPFSLKVLLNFFSPKNSSFNTTNFSFLGASY